MNKLIGCLKKELSEPIIINIKNCTPDKHIIIPNKTIAILCGLISQLYIFSAVNWLQNNNYINFALAVFVSFFVFLPIADLQMKAHEKSRK